MGVLFDGVSKVFEVFFYLRRKYSIINSAALGCSFAWPPSNIARSSGRTLAHCTQQYTHTACQSSNTAIGRALGPREVSCLPHIAPPLARSDNKYYITCQSCKERLMLPHGEFYHQTEQTQTSGCDTEGEYIFQATEKKTVVDRWCDIKGFYSSVPETNKLL